MTFQIRRTEGGEIQGCLDCGSQVELTEVVRVVNPVYLCQFCVGALSHRAETLSRGEAAKMLNTLLEAFKKASGESEKRRRGKW